MVVLPRNCGRAADWTSRFTYRRPQLNQQTTSNLPATYSSFSYRHHEWRSSVTSIWSSTASRGRLLIVDDDPSLQTLLRILLTSSGFDVTTAGDGRQALALAQNGDYDLILLDLEMPLMNGREFYGEFRLHNTHTPVIIVSAYGADVGQRELGAQGSIAKPFDPMNVQRIVESFLTPKL